MDFANKYIIITPARDEEEHIEQTIKSVIHQSILPVRWVIVNDGSSDNTGSIIDAYAKKFDWILTLHRKNRGFRNSAGGEVEALYDGYKLIESVKWEFIVKLDGDLLFDSDYFEKCLHFFSLNKRLGIGGGSIYLMDSNKNLKLEKCPVFHVRGATKIYRKECWENIGGILTIPGWDTIDEVKANMLGWETQSSPDIKIIQLRDTGGPEGTWRDSVKNGLANYITGYHPLFMFLKCLKRIFQKPYGVMAIGLMYGFLSGYVKKIPQVDDQELIRYVRKEQINKLLFKPSIWK